MFPVIDGSIKRDPSYGVNPMRILKIANIVFLVACWFSSYGYAQSTLYTDPPSKEFLRSWLLCGSFPIQCATPDAVIQPGFHDMSSQEKKFYRAAFEFDYLAAQGGEAAAYPKEGSTLTLGGKQYTWTRLNSDMNDIDLRAWSNPSEDVVVYAFADFTITEAKPMILGLGSDDGAKVWLNGEVVHSNPRDRSLNMDDDYIRVNLKQGVNRVLLKIQNQKLDYEFMFRFIAPEDFKEIQFKRYNKNTVEYFIHLIGGFFENKDQDSNN